MNEHIESYIDEYAERLRAAAEDLSKKILDHEITATDLGEITDLITREAESFIDLLKFTFAEKGELLPEDKAEHIKNHLICAHIKATGMLFEKVRRLDPAARNADNAEKSEML